MERFGFISTRLEFPGLWNRLSAWVPERLLYWHGPVETGEITGQISPAKTGSEADPISGFGWKLPANPDRTWNEQNHDRIWSGFLHELSERGVGVLGIDSAFVFSPSFRQSNQFVLPGLSDGKAWELFFFLQRFRSLLRNYSIPARKARAAIIWEEGNLGATCARLIAPELRFLTLISPQARLLERAGGQVLAETGISPQLFTELKPEGGAECFPGGAKIVIICGRLRHYQMPRKMRGSIQIKLFQTSPSLTAINQKLPLIASSHQKPLPVYPALGETIVRLKMKVHSGFWCGPDLPLERVLRMGHLLKELGLSVSSQ